jgi:hypothetical protein
VAQSLTFRIEGSALYGEGPLLKNAHAEEKMRSSKQKIKKTSMGKELEI